MERDRIRVTIRIRPMNSYEMEKNSNEILTYDDSTTIIVEGKSHDRKFTFDGVMTQGASQEDVFDHSGIKRLVDMAIDGYVNRSFFRI
jgi:kinesin family protein 12